MVVLGNNLICALLFIYRAEVLYDRAPEFFRRLEPNEAHELLGKLKSELSGPAKTWGMHLDENTTLLTRKREKGKEREVNYPYLQSLWDCVIMLN